MQSCVLYAHAHIFLCINLQVTNKESTGTIMIRTDENVAYGLSIGLNQVSEVFRYKFIFL